MLIAAGALVQFVKFMQITLLIILPLFAAAVAYTIYIHYRRKKLEAVPLIKPDPVFRLISATPEVINYEEVEGDYVQFDQSALVKEYKSKLIYSHARFTALQKDYESLQDKCDALLMLIEPGSPINKSNIMEDQQLQGVQPVTLQIANEQQNNSDDAACLKDLLNEKAAHLGFLQQQLDQRIRSFHQSEKQVADLRAQVDELRQGSVAVNTTIDELSIALAEKESRIKELQEKLDEKENLLSGKQDLVVWLENTLRDSRDQNEILNAMLADNADMINSLQSAIETEKAKTGSLQQKLDTNRQVLKRLFNELALSMEPDRDTGSPVVELKAAFVKDPEEAFAETVV